MKNTPSPLDIIFIRPDGTIARDRREHRALLETPSPRASRSRAVLEINGGQRGRTGDRAGRQGQLDAVIGV